MNLLCVQRNTRIPLILKVISQRTKGISIRISELRNGTLYLTIFSHTKWIARCFVIRGLPGPANIPKVAIDTLSRASSSEGTSVSNYISHQ